MHAVSLSYTQCKIIGQTEIQGQLIHTLSTVRLPVIFKILNISCTGFVAQNTLVTLHSVLRFTISHPREKTNQRVTAPQNTPHFHISLMCSAGICVYCSLKCFVCSPHKKFSWRAYDSNVPWIESFKAASQSSQGEKPGPGLKRAL